MRWAFAVALLLSAGCLDAYTISVPATASLRVLVVDVESQPVAGADVFIGTSNVWGVTGIDGSTLIAGLEPGPQALSVSKSGFETATTTVELEAGRAAHADITLLAKPLPSLRTYLWTDEGVCSRSTAPGAPTTACGAKATATSRPESKPHWPKDVYNLTITVNWTGPLKQVEFEAVFGDRLPLRDGRVAINLSGESPLVVTLEPHLISKAMRRPGSAPTVRAVRPMGNAPSEYSQTFHAKVQALYRDPSPMAAFPLNTTLSSQNFTFPRSSGDAPVAGSFQIEGIDHVIEVRPRLRYDCPYQSGGANLTFTDAFGRSFVETFRDYGTSPSTYRVCVLSEAQQFSSERRQVLWDGPGTWEFRSGGTCACRLWLEVVREDWAGLE